MRAILRPLFVLPLALVVSAPLSGQDLDALHGTVDELAAAFNDQVVAWRRDIHANPELGMQEFRTAALVAEHLDSLGIEVRTGVGGTGVVGVLRGGRPGPVVALSRQVDLTDSPAIVTIGQIEGGNRGNIIPDTVLMIGTIRTLNPDTRELVHERVRRMAEKIAEANGAEADVEINLGYPVTVNDPALTRSMAPSIERIVGDGAVVMPPLTGAEDFSYFTEEVPGMFIGLGVGADDPSLVHPNHSPYFYADERALPIGVRAMASLAVDFLTRNPITEE